MCVCMYVLHTNKGDKIVNLEKAEHSQNKSLNGKEIWEKIRRNYMQLTVKR